MLIFLDIDGVMVSGASWRIPENLEDGFPMFMPKAVMALKDLVAKDTQVILTTSHKARFTPTEWRKIFERRDIKVDNLTCLDQTQDSKNRKDELLKWFELHPVDQDFIIIDDDNSLHGLPLEFKKHLIMTSPLIGLTIDHVNSLQRQKLNEITV